MKLTNSKSLIKYIYSCVYLFFNLFERDSRKVLLKVFSKRLFNFKYFKFDNFSEFKKNFNIHKEKIKLKKNHEWVADKFLIDLKSLKNIPIKLYTNDWAAFMLDKHYQLTNKNVSFTPKKGDVVLDLGAYTGENCVYYSYLVGDSGSVYAFEFIEANLENLEKNLNLNKNFSSNVKIIKKPVSDKIKKIYTSDQGPGTIIHDKKADHLELEYETVTIDQFSKDCDLKRIDCIKMDIEGSEYEALLGGFETIKKFKPNLCISAYHKIDDFYKLTKLIKKISKDYRFYLEHYHTSYMETVLYATCKK